MTASTAPSRLRSTYRPASVWLVLCALAFWRLDRAGRGLSFFFDEWDWLITRRHGIASLLHAHNGHFSLVPSVAFRVLMRTAGLAHYAPYRWVGLVVHLGVASAVAGIVGRRRGPVVGLALGATILFLGAGWENILWPFQIGMMGSLGFGLLAWLLLDARTTRCDVAAAVALCLSIASSGPGIALTGGVIVRLLWARADRQRVWAAAPAVVLWGGWWLKYGEPQGKVGNLRWIGSYVRDSAAGAIAALAGRNLDWGRTAIGFALAVALGTVARRRSASPAAVGMAAALVANWVLTTFARGDLQEPAGSRYVYLGAAMLVVLWAELYPRTPNGAGRRSARWWTVATVLLALVAIRGNRHQFELGEAGLHHTSAIVSAELRAVEWAHEPPPDYRVDERLAPPLFAGSYLAMTRDLQSSPAFTDRQLAASVDDARAAADRTSAALGGPFVQPAPAPPSGACGTPTTDAAVQLDPASATVVVPGDAAIEVRLRRLVSQFPEDPTATIDPGQPVRLSRPVGDGPATWYADLHAASPFQLCRNGG